MANDPPSGWYPDPADPSGQRYWNGFEWTEHTAPGAASASGGGGADAGAGGDGSGRDVWPSGDRVAATGGPQHAATVNTWTWQSFVVTLLCGGTVISMVGILNAGKAEGALAAGDIASARAFATKARNWTIAGLAFGLLFIVIGVVALVTFASSVGSLAADCDTVGPGDGFQYQLCQSLCEAAPNDPACLEFQG